MNKTEAIKRAVKLSKSTGVTIIVYQDRNEGFEGFDMTSENHFDFLVDINWCDYSDIVAVIEP